MTLGGSIFHTSATLPWTIITFVVEYFEDTCSKEMYQKDHPLGLFLKYPMVSFDHIPLKWSIIAHICVMLHSANIMYTSNRTTGKVLKEYIQQF